MVAVKVQSLIYTYINILSLVDSKDEEEEEEDDKHKEEDELDHVNVCTWGSRCSLRNRTNPRLLIPFAKFPIN